MGDSRFKPNRWTKALGSFFSFFLGLEVKEILCVFFFFFGDIQNSNSPISLQVPNYQQKEKKKKDTNPIIISLTKKH